MFRQSSARLFALLASLCAAIGCGLTETARIDSELLERGPDGPLLRVIIVGKPGDPRVPPIREAIVHWNGELRRLGRRVQLDSGTVIDDSIPDDILRAASGEVMFGGGRATRRLASRLSGMPGDIVVALSRTDLISFGIPWHGGGNGVIALRRSDVLPLSLPNTVRNVVAHELGHVLGLSHNADSTTLMCGRPARCRPASFASDSAYFFPLTPSDEQRVRERWP